MRLVKNHPGDPVFAQQLVEIERLHFDLYALSSIPGPKAEWTSIAEPMIFMRDVIAFHFSVSSARSVVNWARENA